MNNQNEKKRLFHIGNVNQVRNHNNVNLSLYYQETISKHISGKSNIFIFKSFIVDNDTNNEIGYFLIQGNGYSHFYENTPDMTIQLNEEWRGTGLSRLLIFLCTNGMNQITYQYKLEEQNPIIYIDVDGSDMIDVIHDKSFWDIVGMKKGRYAESETTRNIQGVGYEKEIEFNKLKMFGDKNKITINYVMNMLIGSGKKKKYTKKKTKKYTKKKNRDKKRNKKTKSNRKSKSKSKSKSKKIKKNKNKSKKNIK